MGSTGVRCKIMKPLKVLELPLDKKVLIEASAGTGKTFTIGLIVLRLLLKEKEPLTIDKIVLITFTTAATAELKKKTAEKIREAYALWENGAKENDSKDLIAIIEQAKKGNELQNKARLLEALARIDEMPIFTIHGFCEKLLSEFSYEMKLFEERELCPDISDVKNRVIAKFWRENVKNLDVLMKLNPEELSSSISVILNHRQATVVGESLEDALENYANDKDVPKKKKEAEKKIKYALAYNLAKIVNKDLDCEKQKLKIRSYDDLINDCWNAVTKEKNEKINLLQKAIAKRYEAILVDEFQDTDKTQFEIFDYLFKGKPFFMIGDPKQAIYKFRGGDIFAYRDARKSAGENQFSMSQNFRSEESVLNALDSFFGSESFAGKMGDEIEYTHVECGSNLVKPIAPICEIDNEYGNSSFIIWKGIAGENKPEFEKKVQKATINEIKRLLAIKEIEPKDIAILLNKNSDCIKYQKSLAKENIYAVVSGDSVFNSDAAYFMQILLNAMCFNNDVKFIRSLLLHTFCGFEPKEITEILLNDWLSLIYRAKDKWKQKGVMNAVDFFMREKNLWGQIAANNNGERNITNIRQLVEILNDEEVKFGKVPEKMNARFAALCSDSKKYEETEEKLETDEGALKIMTIHKSKGLEFKIVFIPDVSKSPQAHKFPNAYIYHNDKKEEIIAYYAEEKNLKKENDKEENEETARLLYVALTRAKLRLYAAFSPCKIKKDGGISASSGAASICREIFENFCKGKTDEYICINELEEIYEKEYKYNTSLPLISQKKKAKIFSSNNTQPAWQRTSFSDISGRYLETNHTTAHNSTQTSDLPKGAAFGTLLHEIFETIDFKAGKAEIKSIVKNKLGNFKNLSESVEGFERRREIIEKWVYTILNKSLKNGAGKLSDIKQNNKISELNFFMKADEINLQKIEEIMGSKILFSEKTNEMVNEFIKGAIDLIFLGADEKYYILDWKSNYLGEDDYTREVMEAAMLESGYHLQYYIYAVALKRWLEQIYGEEFNFKEKFGGVYYVFIRGVKREENNFDGIFFENGENIAGEVEEMDFSLIFQN